MPQKNTEKPVVFELVAPEAESVVLAASFNDWDTSCPAMQVDEEGTWRITVNLKPGEHEYRFIVDGEWRDDPGCQDSCLNPFGTHNAVIRT